MSYDEVLNIHVKYPFKLLIVGALLTFLIIIGVQFSIYDVYTIVGVSTGDAILLNVPLEYSDTLNHGEYLKIGDNTYSFLILSIGELEFDWDQQVNYQTYSIKVDAKFLKNEVIKMTVYYDKEKIIENAFRFKKTYEEKMKDKHIHVIIHQPKIL